MKPTKQRGGHTAHEAARWAQDDEQPGDRLDDATKHQIAQAEERTRQARGQGFAAAMKRGG